MELIGLNGDWRYQRIGGDEHGVGVVPGDIYADLLANKQIPDPFLFESTPKH